MSDAKRLKALEDDNAKLKKLLADQIGAIAEWRQDFNTARPHSYLGYQTPAAFAGTLAATGSDASLDRGSASPPVAQPAPYGVTETAEPQARAVPQLQPSSIVISARLRRRASATNIRDMAW